MAKLRNFINGEHETVCDYDSNHTHNLTQSIKLVHSSGMICSIGNYLPAITGLLHWPKKFQTEMEQSAEAEMIYFPSGLHCNEVTGAECPSPLPWKTKLFRPCIEYTKTSFVSVPNARYLPEGLILIDVTLYGYGIWATGCCSSQSQNRIGDPWPAVTSSNSLSILCVMPQWVPFWICLNCTRYSFFKS